jgi:small subunit ribosomal protein S17
MSEQNEKKTEELVENEAATEEAVTDEATTEEAVTEEAATDEATTEEAAADEAPAADVPPPPAADEAAADEPTETAEAEADEAPVEAPVLETNDPTEARSADAEAKEAAAEQGRVWRQRRKAIGLVVSAANDKTVVVKVERRFRHPKYRKFIKRSKRYAAHDEHNVCEVGDLVVIEECRPLSKRKRWRFKSTIRKKA